MFIQKATSKHERRAPPYRYVLKDVPVEPTTTCGFEGCIVELPAADDKIQLFVEDFHQAPKFDGKLTRKFIWQKICKRHQELDPIEQGNPPDWPLHTDFVLLSKTLIAKVDGWLNEALSDDVSLVSCAGWLPFVSSIMLSCEDAFEFASTDEITRINLTPDFSCAG